MPPNCRNPKSKLLVLLFEVVESKMNRDKESNLEKHLREARIENKYHLVQNYNNDLIRRSLKSQNNHNRLNVKEHRANIHQDNIAKKIDERNRIKMTQLIQGPQNQLKSLGAQRRPEGLQIEVSMQSDSIDRLGAKAGERGSNLSYAPNTVSSNTTPNSNLSFSTNKSHRAAPRKEKAVDVIEKINQKLLIKNSLIQRLKKRNTSKASNKSNRSSLSKETLSNKAPVTKQSEVGSKQEDRILHLTLNGAKHNTNLVQINNYIGKHHREDGESVGDNCSHRQSTNSNSSNIYSNKLRKLRKPDSVHSKDMDMQYQGNKMRKEILNPLKFQSKLPISGPILSNIQNKNVLTLTQNLLQKRQKNE